MNDTTNDKAKVLIMGVGNSGINIINYFINNNIDIRDAEYCTVCSDEKFLGVSLAQVKIQAGKALTKGLGTGGDVEAGEKAVKEVLEEIDNVLKNKDVLFLLTAMGGGMSTGGTSAVAERAKELGIKTICVVAKPFKFEGKVRRTRAEEGMKKLKGLADAVIPVSNDNALRCADSEINMSEIFDKIHNTMAITVTSIYEIITLRGLISIEFEDIEYVMRDVTDCIIGTGCASGKNRAKRAVLMAVESDEIKKVLKKSESIMLNISGGPDMTLHDVAEAVDIINEESNDFAKIVVGCVVDDNIKEEIRIVLIAGIGEQI